MIGRGGRGKGTNNNFLLISGGVELGFGLVFWGRVSEIEPVMVEIEPSMHVSEDEINFGRRP